jgi:hypothetical protein
MGICTVFSTLQLVTAAASSWVKLPEEPQHGDITPTLKRQSVVNIMVALGATAAAVMSTVWATACGARP